MIFRSRLLSVLILAVVTIGFVAFLLSNASKRLDVKNMNVTTSTAITKAVQTITSTTAKNVTTVAFERPECSIAYLLNLTDLRQAT